MTVAKFLTFGLSFVWRTSITPSPCRRTPPCSTRSGVRGREARFSAKTCGGRSRSIWLRPCGCLDGAGPWWTHPRIWSAGDAAAAELAKKYAQRIRNLPFFKHRMERDKRPGWNQWAVSGRSAASGHPLVANDPHLALDEPSTFYPIHLTAGSVDAMGSGFAGVPFVIVGQTRHIAWARR